MGMLVGPGREMGTLAGQGEGTSVGAGRWGHRWGDREMGHWRGTGGWPPCPPDDGNTGPLLLLGAGDRQALAWPFWSDCLSWPYLCSLSLLKCELYIT